MSIIEDTAGNITVTGDDVRTYRLLALRTSLLLEIRGVKNSKGSICPMLRKEFGLKSKTKSKLLTEYERMLRARGVDFA